MVRGGGTSAREEGRGSSTGEIIWLTVKLEEAFSCSLCCIRTLSVRNEINIVVTVRNEVAKGMSVSHSVHGGGMLSHHALQVVSQHSLRQEVCSWGTPAPGGAFSRGWCSGEVCSCGGAYSGGGCLLPAGVWRPPFPPPTPPPKSRLLLLRTVRILLECILVSPKSGTFSLDFSCILLCWLLTVSISDEERTEQMHWSFISCNEHHIYLMIHRVTLWG